MLFLSDCSLIIAMLKQLVQAPKICSSRLWKDEEVNELGSLGYSCPRSVPVLVGQEVAFALGLLLSWLHLPKDRMTSCLKVISWQSIYSLLKSCKIIFMKL